MAAMSDAFEGALIDHVFRSGTLPKPANVYFALFTTSPTDAGGGTEVSGGGYQRAEVATADANFSSPSSGDGKVTNLNPVMFPFPAAAWGDITHWAVFNAASGGLLMFQGALENPLSVVAGDPPVIFMPGDFELIFD